MSDSITTTTAMVMNSRLFRVALVVAGSALVLLLYAVHKDDAPVTLVRERVSIDGLSRAFWLSAPPVGHRVEVVVFVFHGTGDDALSMARSAQLGSWSNDNQAIVIYPEAVVGIWGGTVDMSDPSLDIRYIEAIRQKVDKKFDSAGKPLVLAGLSNGGVFAQIVAQKSSLPCSAVLVHSASLPRHIDLAQTEKPFPILFVVGGSDSEILLQAARDSVSAYQSAGYPANLLVVPGLGHEWAADYNPLMWKMLSRVERRVGDE